MPTSSESLILCATSRLAQSLRWQYDRAQAAAGATQWPTLNTATVAQWFAALSEEALLRGNAEGLLTRRVLDAFQESLLWEKVITESIPDYATSFFDVPSMSATAAEAHELMVVWGINPMSPVAAYATDETQEFLRWRRKFLELCGKQGLIDAAQLHEAVLALVESGTLQLPREVRFAGFDNITPQERRLKQLLAQQDVTIADWQATESAPTALEIRMLPEADAERRAVAQWAAAWLVRDPAAHLGIVTPNLGKARDAIESALDDALHPALLRPSKVEAPRCYNFSLGKPLTQHPLVAVALELIEFTCGSGEVEQARIGELLRHPCWSASISEADARARFEAAMRDKLPATTTVGRVLSFAQWFGGATGVAPSVVSDDSGETAPPFFDDAIPLFDEDGEIIPLPPGGGGARGEGEITPRIPVLLAHLGAIEAARREWKKKVLPSQWAARIRQLLRAAGWPGERALSSHEFQARQAFIDELNKLAALDGILGEIAARDAHRRLTQLCNAHVFQAETVNEPQVQVVGMLEAGGMHFDALWVMGMTDDVWPPAPRPNPLLPAEMQRAAGAPNSSAQAQLAFADSIHQRLLQCAPDITFSFSRMEGATELRASPLLAQHFPLSPAPSPTRGEGSESPSPLVGEGLGRGGIWATPLDDSTAPRVKEGEHVHGGTGLLRAQAICPAWAYFRYRLGAKKLQTPVEGLDAAARGSIVHEALRSFWVAIGATGSSATLRAMNESERNAAIDNAADDALIEYDDEHRAAPLPPMFRKLERERLQRLLGNWLAVELQREQPFSAVSCEESIKVDIEGIVCNLQIDRIDQLEDGRRIVIDYKTGAVAGYKSWAEMRITDPQLPIYAAIAQPEQLTSAVAFAKVQLDDSAFLGIASDDGLLPRVPGVDSRDGRRVFSADEFADWQAVLNHWRTSIHEIALEVKFGAAAVTVADEADLRYCDVLPILRLAERRAQWESAMAEGAEK